MFTKLLATLAIAASALSPNVTSATGSNGAVLSVSNANNLKSGTSVLVSGKNFDVTTGIYVELCVVVPKTVLPHPCGGGENMSGASAASFWISSNPPPYGKGLAIPYGPGGTFKVKLSVSPMIGKIDCRVSKCAIYVRADHLRTDDRSHDIHVPVTFAR